MNLTTFRARWFWLLLASVAAVLLWVGTRSVLASPARWALWAGLTLVACALLASIPSAGAAPGGPPAAEERPEPGRGLGRGRGQENSLLAAVLEGMGEGVLVVDMGQRVIHCNDAASALMNRPGKEAVGRPLWESVRHREIGDMVREVLGDGRERTREISPSLPAESFFRVSARPFTAGGEPAGLVITFSDLTGLRKLENTRKDFVANVSHELRTPLTALRSALETLLDGALEDPRYAKDFLETAQNQVDRLQRLIDDLLTLSRLDKPRSSERVGADVSAVVEKIIQVLAPVARGRGVSMEASWPSKPLPVAFSPDELAQVFMNLLDNGIKFNKPQGRLSVTAAVGPAVVEVSVRDTGVGIPAESLPRIFERFYRVDKARSSDLGGTGLGLAIVKNIVEKGGGKVRVESVPGDGTVFYLDLPRAG